jgi:hypothetical protein
MALPDLTNLFIADSYKGVLHTSNVPLSGANLPPVYDGLGNKSSLRLGSDGNGASVSGCLSADCIDIAGFTLIDYLYPVGAVYLDTLDVNPQTRFVGTTWGKISEGKFLAGVGSGADKNLTNQILLAGDDASIGEYTHRLTVTEMPSHTHDLTSFSYVGDRDNDENKGYWDQGGTLTTQSTGGDQPHNNIPPYFGVYIWKRLT